MDSVIGPECAHYLVERSFGNEELFYTAFSMLLGFKLGEFEVTFSNDCVSLQKQQRLLPEGSELLLFGEFAVAHALVML